MMGAGLVPFVVCTALKVNPISVLTGYSHEKLQVFHQWLARLFLFLSIVHTLPFIIQPSIEGGASNLHAYFMSENIYWNGTAALILLVWIVCTGSGIVRRMSYEIFVVQHIVTAIGLLVCLLLHFERILNSHLWVWSAVALWSFSTTVRAFMAIFSSEFVFTKRAELEVQQLQNDTYSALNLNEQRDSELFKLTMSTPIRWKPGQHVYMRFPSINPLENHPFTIASLPGTIPNVNSRMEFYVRVFCGMTRKLYKRASMPSQTAPNCCVEKRAETPSKKSHSTESNNDDNAPFSVDSTKIMVLVDGPYGSSTDPAIFECAMFVAGGTGATFVLPVLNDLLRRMRAGKHVVTKRIHFIWAARSLSAY
jgi:predicted ferric reductase